jgi:hypothetical protein
VRRCIAAAASISAALLRCTAAYYQRLTPQCHRPRHSQGDAPAAPRCERAAQRRAVQFCLRHACERGRLYLRPVAGCGRGGLRGDARRRGCGAGRGRECRWLVR